MRIQFRAANEVTVRIAETNNWSSSQNNAGQLQIIRKNFLKG